MSKEHENRVLSGFVCSLSDCKDRHFCKDPCNQTVCIHEAMWCEGAGDCLKKAEGAGQSEKIYEQFVVISVTTSSPVSSVNVSVVTLMGSINHSLKDA